MKTPIGLAVTTVGLALVIAACSSDAQQAPEVEPASTADVAAGAELYAANCARCHGEDLRGTDNGPPHLDRVYEPSHHGDAAFAIAVQRGAPQHHWDFGPMPPIEGLDDAEIADIIAFVRQEQRAVGIE